MNALDIAVIKAGGKLPNPTFQEKRENSGIA